MLKSIRKKRGMAASLAKKKVPTGGDTGRNGERKKSSEQKIDNIKICDLICIRCSEVETLGHVLGYCPKGELLRNNRHHKVRSSIATTLRKAKWEVYEEVHCLAENGSTRRADIIAIDLRNQRSLILDPTVRFEKDDQQANNVNDEKKYIWRDTK
ncbi:hypothetical protein ANN_04164 [Periplaneta americana]|uniref:Reverse transcriptase n=1 Tax=Periplaneta americana TaxID=6978 RepID=A0ABQ8T9U7_PERAM|nr:hypothetical protein ANN_04164 [Periplaneta americana]